MPITKQNPEAMDISKAKNDSDYWNNASQKQAMDFFHLAAERVPAYKDVLKEYKIKPNEIKTFDDFKKLPVIDKENYVHKYPLDQRCIDGNIASGNIFSISSGSTGEPQYWSKDQTIDEQNEWLFELIFKNSFELESRKTLLLSAFTLGTWVAGTSMFVLSLSASNRGYPLVVVSTSINVQDILRTAAKLGPLYDQTVIAGYPPFVKDVLEEGRALGIEWDKLNTKFVFGGEAISEPWRDYVLKKVGAKNPLTDAVNLFGTAEGGAMGIETPPAISLKRLAHNRPELSKKLFNSERMPAIYQYNPTMRFFESINDELVFSIGGPMPLIRYNLHDSGGVLRRDELDKFLKKNGTKLFSDVKPSDYKKYNYGLPFVYLFGRPHNNATLYSVNIYPENIKAVLEDLSVADNVTGKFKMSTEFDEDMNQYLLLRVELAKGKKISSSLKNKILSLISSRVPKLNSEYGRLAEEIGKKAIPRLELFENGDPIFRPGGIKQTHTVKK